MKTLSILAGASLLLSVAAHAQQHNAPDSLHIRLMTNKNGTVMNLDTTVARAQQQQLMSWLSSQGIEMPPLPDSLPGLPPMIALNDSIVRVVEFNNSAFPPDVKIMTIDAQGAPGLPPLPEMPPMPEMQNITIRIDSAGEVITCHPVPGPDGKLPPLPPMPPAPNGMPCKVLVMNTDSAGQTIIKQVIIQGEMKDPATPNSGRKEASSTNTMEVYPNPSNGRITLAFDLPGKAKTDISITDMNGRIVYEEQLGENVGAYKKEIAINGGKGTYLVRVQKGDQVLMKQVIVQ